MRDRSGREEGTARYSRRGGEEKLLKVVFAGRTLIPGYKEEEIYRGSRRTEAGGKVRARTTWGTSLGQQERIQAAGEIKYEFSETALLVRVVIPEVPLDNCRSNFFT